MSRPIPAEIEPKPGQSRAAAKALQELGFKILHLGPTISVEAPEELWRSTFEVRFANARKQQLRGVDASEVSYRRARTDTVSIPESLERLVASVAFVEPPELP